MRTWNFPLLCCLGFSASGALIASARAQTPLVAEHARVISPRPEFHDWFGREIALRDDLLVAGVAGDGTLGLGVGAVYVYAAGSGGWDLEQTLFASGPEVNDRFGSAVALHGDWMAVGATGDGGGGSVRVFERSAGGWVERQTLVDPEIGLNDDFGSSVAVGSRTIVVGARHFSSGPALLMGKAFVFEHDGSTWAKTQGLLGSDTNGGDRFGSAIVLERGLLAIASEGEGSDGDPPTVHLFERSGGVWVEVDKLVPPATVEPYGFACDVAVSGERVVVGHRLDDELGPSTGAAYVFERNGPTWSQAAKLRAPDQDLQDRFGFSVAIDGERIAVGATHHDHSGSSSGGAWIFERAGDAWHAQLELVPADAESGDELGTAVALDSGVLAASAMRDDHSGTFQAGTVYLLDLARTPFVPRCIGDGSGSACPCGNSSAPGGSAGCASSTGAGARLVASGSADATVDDLAFHAADLPPFAMSMLVVGAGVPGGGAPVGDGLRCVGVGRSVLATLQANAQGLVSFGPGLGTSVVPGDLRHFQVFYDDPGASPCGPGLNATNAVSVQFAP